MVQLVFIIMIWEVEVVVGVMVFGMEVSGYGGCVGGFYQVIQFQVFNVLGVEFVGGIVDMGVFQVFVDYFQLFQIFVYCIVFVEY